MFYVYKTLTIDISQVNNNLNSIVVLNSIVITMVDKKRLGISLILGFLLGLVCVFGVGIRIGLVGNGLFLLAMVYNRVLLGLIIAMVNDITIIEQERYNSLIRGAIFGLVVTTAIFLSSEFRDIPAFFAGILYGIIIDGVATYYTEK